MDNESTTSMRIVVTGSVATHAEKKPAKLFGKDFSIFPSTMMVAGSHYPHVERAAKPTSIHFSEQELQRSVNTWNGRPVSINHPDNQITCNSPDTYNRQWVGYVFNARYDKPAKSLKSELWIENERGKVINDLVSSGKQLEVSIGVFGQLKKSTGNDPFDFDMANIVGDHLAILPNSKGACSWEDGCGIRAEQYRPAPELIEETNIETRGEGMEQCQKRASMNDCETEYSKSENNNEQNERPNPKKRPPQNQSLQQKNQEQASTNDYTKRNESELLDLDKKSKMPPKKTESNYLENQTKKEVRLDEARHLKNVSKEKTPTLNAKERKRLDLGKKNDTSDKTNYGEKQNMETKSGSTFNREEWLSQAPSEYRDYVSNAMQTYESSHAYVTEKRESYISKILACKSSVFCEKALNSLEDISILEGISGLVTALEDTSNVVAATSSGNYQFKAGSTGKKAEDAPTYATFKDINFKEIEEERQEKERVRSVRHG